MNEKICPKCSGKTERSSSVFDDYDFIGCMKCDWMKKVKVNYGKKK